MGWMAAAVSLAGAAAPGARADVLRLDNNDLMHGKVVGADEKNVTFKHVNAGDLKIPWANIIYVETDEPVSIKLQNGNVIKSKLGIGGAPRTTKVDVEGKESAQIGLDRIASLNEVTEAIWTGRIALGMTIQDGNTNTKAMFASFDGERKTKRDRMEAHGLYNYGETEGEVTSRNSFARAQYSLYMPFWNPLYVYIGAAIERDKFKDLELRTRGGGGFGYEVWGGPDRILRFEGGVEYVHEDLDGDPPPGSNAADIAAFLRDNGDRDFVALRLAMQFEYQITEWLRVAEMLEYLPNTENFKDFVTRSTSSATVNIWGGFGFAGVIIWLHDDVPAAGQGRNDTTYILTLTYTF